MAENTETTYIDLKQSWGQVGRMYTRLANSGERKACKAMETEALNAFGFATAFQVIFHSLSAEQKKLATDAYLEAVGQTPALGAAR